MSGFVLRAALLMVSGFAPVSDASGVYQLQAQKLIDQQRFQEALKLLDQAWMENPKNTDILYLRGYTLYRLRDLDKARTQLEEVTQLNPPALRACYFLGRIALLEGHPEEAIRWLKPPAQGTPPIEDSPAQLGQAYLDAHQLEAARDWTNRALQAAPWDGNVHYRLARIYQQLGESDAAAKEFQTSVDLKTTDREAVEKLVTSGQEISRGNVGKAREIRDSLLRQPQLDPDVLVALGSSFAAAGMPEDAMALFKEASARDATSFQAHFDLGLAFLKTGHPSEAVDPLEASLRIAPSSIECNEAIGLDYVLLGRFQEALPRLELVHSAQPENRRTEGLLALAYLRTGAASKAIPIVETNLTKQKDDPKLYFLLIECLNSVERQAEALPVADEAVQRFPTLAKAHLAKGQQLARLGRYEEAGPSFAKAVELSPQEIEPLLGLAEARNKSGAYGGSLASYQRVLELDPRNLTAQLGAAKDLVSLSKISEAKDLLEKAAADHPDNSQIHFELSRVFARLGARDEAAKETQIVQRLRNQAPASTSTPQ